MKPCHENLLTNTIKSDPWSPRRESSSLDMSPFSLVYGSCFSWQLLLWQTWCILLAWCISRATMNQLAERQGSPRIVLKFRWNGTLHFWTTNSTSMCRESSTQLCCLLAVGLSRSQYILIPTQQPCSLSAWGFMGKWIAEYIKKSSGVCNSTSTDKLWLISILVFQFLRNSPLLTTCVSIHGQVN